MFICIGALATCLSMHFKTSKVNLSETLRKYYGLLCIYYVPWGTTDFGSVQQWHVGTAQI